MSLFSAIDVCKISFLYLVISIYLTHLKAASPTATTKIDDVCNLNHWSSFKTQYSRKYEANSDEDVTRFATFCKNFHKIQLHNANPAKTYTMELNQFSDRTQDELAQLFGNEDSLMNGDNGLQSNSAELTSYEELLRYLNKSSSLNQDEIPDELDWSLDVSRVSPVGDQGDCGSCWAFSVVGLLEGQQTRSLNRTIVVPLSVQNLVDCDRINQGCSSGEMDVSLEQIREFGGVMRADDYEYVSGATSNKGVCRMQKSKVFESTTRLGETKKLEPGNEELLRKVVATYGPVSIGILAPVDLLSYKDGVYYDPRNRGFKHAVLLVGYGKDKRSGLDYWKIKNSWSGTWGLQGYALMSRNRDNNCNIATWPVISLPPTDRSNA